MMIAAEFKTQAATVRIHSDWLEPMSEDRAARLGRIVSRSYQRRLEDGGEGAVAAFRPGGVPEKI